MELPKQITEDDSVFLVGDVTDSGQNVLIKELVRRYNAYEKDQQTIKELVEACEDSEKTVQAIKENIYEPDKILCLVEKRLFSLQHALTKAKE